MGINAGAVAPTPRGLLGAVLLPLVCLIRLLANLLSEIILLGLAFPCVFPAFANY